MELRFSVDRTSVQPAEFAEALVRQAKDAVRVEVQRRVSGLRCPTHSQAPTLVSEGISCCCSELEAVVRAVFPD